MARECLFVFDRVFTHIPSLSLSLSLRYTHPLTERSLTPAQHVRVTLQSKEKVRCLKFLNIVTTHTFVMYYSDLMLETIRTIGDVPEQFK